jgi:hypothetical protein
VMNSLKNSQIPSWRGNSNTPKLLHKIERKVHSVMNSLKNSQILHEEAIATLLNFSTK